MVLALGLPDRHFILHLLPFLRIDNGRMALVHNVLRHLALVDLHLFGKEIHGEFLLQDRRALVFFVRQDALYGAGLPFFLAARRGDALGCKVCGDPVHRFALNEQFVDFPYNLRLLRHNLRQAVRPFAVAEEGFIRQRHLSVCKAFSLAPCDIFGNGAALLLGKARHDGDQQFALATLSLSFIRKKMILG